jgi:archaellum biogenesis protein FlaJ (TadC family)
MSNTVIIYLLRIVLLLIIFGLVYWLLYAVPNSDVYNFTEKEQQEQHEIK